MMGSVSLCNAWVGLFVVTWWTVRLARTHRSAGPRCSLLKERHRRLALHCWAKTPLHNLCPRVSLQPRSNPSPRTCDWLRTVRWEKNWEEPGSAEREDREAASQVSSFTNRIRQRGEQMVKIPESKPLLTPFHGTPARCTNEGDAQRAFSTSGCVPSLQPDFSFSHFLYTRPRITHQAHQATRLTAAMRV